MSDIFDDVEKMLAEENDEVIEAKTSENIDEASFNESELEDIMAEIESLESDFHDSTEITAAAKKDYVAEELAEDSEFVAEEINDSEDSLVEADMGFTSEETFEHTEVELKTDSSVAPKTDLQIQIEEEMELAKAIIEKEKVEHYHSNVIPMENSKPVVEVQNVVSEVKTVTTMPESTNYASTKNETSFQASGSMNLALTFKLGEKIANLKVEEGKGLTVTLDGVELVLNEYTGCTLKMENGVNINIPLTDKVSSSKKMAA